MPRGTEQGVGSRAVQGAGLTVWGGSSSSLRDAVLGALALAVGSTMPVSPASAGDAGPDKMSERLSRITEIRPGGSCFGAEADRRHGAATEAVVRIVGISRDGRLLVAGTGTVIQDSASGGGANRILTASHVTVNGRSNAPADRVESLRVLSSRGVVLGEARIVASHSGEWSPAGDTASPGADLAVLEMVDPSPAYREIRGMPLVSVGDTGEIMAMSGDGETAGVTSGDSGSAMLVAGADGRLGVGAVLQRAAVFVTPEERRDNAHLLFTSMANVLTASGRIVREPVTREREGESRWQPVRDRDVEAALGEAVRTRQIPASPLRSGSRVLSYGYGAGMCNHARTRVIALQVDRMPSAPAVRVATPRAPVAASPSAPMGRTR